MRAAVIDPGTGAVLNIIMADSALDASPDPGTVLVDAGDLPVTPEWRWSQAEGWIAPEPEPGPATNPLNPVQSF